MELDNCVENSKENANIMLPPANFTPALPKAEKRAASEDLKPVLTRVEDGKTIRIPITKSGFKVGRGREMDYVILEVCVSRNHCSFEEDENGSWLFRNLSRNDTFVNDDAVTQGKIRELKSEDVIRLAPDISLKFALESDMEAKKARLEELARYEDKLKQHETEKTKSEMEKFELQEKVTANQREQEHLKEQLQKLLEEETESREEKEELRKRTEELQEKIRAKTENEGQLQQQFGEVLDKLSQKEADFEAEKQLWQTVTQQEKEELENKIKADLETKMEAWKKEHQAKFELERQAEALRHINEKKALEQMLKEKDEALQKAAEMQQNVIMNVGPEDIIVTYNTDVNPPELRFLKPMEVMETIDLTSEESAGPSKPKSLLKGEDESFSSINKIVNEQFICPICSECFVHATVLSCSHTFCDHCIKEWMKKKKVCPNCRAPIQSLNRSLVIDNFINDIFDKHNDERLKAERRQLVHSRQIASQVVVAQKLTKAAARRANRR